MELTQYQPLLWSLLLIPLAIGFYYSLVDRPSKLKSFSLACRVIGILFLLLALCGPYLFTESKELHVNFLLDVSESVDLKAVEDAIERVEDGLSELELGDSYALFVFANGVKRYEIAEFKDVLETWKQGQSDDEFRSATKLVDGLLASQIQLPAGKAHKIVVLSDGVVIQEELQEVLSNLKNEGVEVQHHRLSPISQKEIVLTDFKANSDRAFLGEMVRMDTTVSANYSSEVKVRLFHKGVLIRERIMDVLANSETVISFEVKMTTPGASVWKAEVVAEEDNFLVNNQLLTTISVQGKPRVLVLDKEKEDMRPFARVLRGQDFEVELRGWNGLPTTMDELLSFDSVVLANFPATQMNVRQMEFIRRYVTEFGGSLAMFGSENSFGLGGYFQTPVEEVLPLVSRYEKEKEKSTLAMVLVIDKSGSMKGLPIALARQAAKAAVDVLSKHDQIAVIGFDSSPLIISDMQLASESVTIHTAIDSLSSGGGTNLYPAMMIGKEMLENTIAKVKHMIILTDGRTQASDHETLTQSMVDVGITVSGVALGGGADRQLLSRISQIGNGRYYETMDPSTVPQIFTKETMEASKSAIKEDLVQAVQVGDHPMLSGYSDADLPFALGYVMTQAKPTAQVLLSTDSGDPLLAISRFGLGMGLAYTSSMNEQWGEEWLAWAECGKFWGQALRAIIRRLDPQGFDVQQRVTEDAWSFDIKREEPNGFPLSRVEWSAEILNESGQMNEMAVREIGLGRYQLEVPLLDQKKLTLRIHDRDHDKLRMFHYHRPYPAEYRLSTEFDQYLFATDLYQPDKIREDLSVKKHKKRIDHYAYFLALFFLCLGILLRRI
ncbi:MAG: VWA domain-containing protein [Verrucomicrobiota bacterium]